MATIDTLVPDIHALLRQERPPAALSSEDWAQFGMRVAQHVLQDVAPPTPRPRAPKTLYASELGTKCLRKLWYRVNLPLLAEQKRAPTLIKFTYGDLTEELILQYARAAGHDVSREQESVEEILPDGWRIRGRIDAVIDGWVVDLKSASSFSFHKYQSEGLVYANDSFGYLDQIGWYSRQLSLPPAFLFSNKETGALHLEKPVWSKALPLTVDRKQLEDTWTLPNRGHDDKVHDSSGGRALRTECSYCDFKAACWPGLRAFAYKGKPPVFLTVVGKTPPRVPELKLEEATGG